MNTGESVRRGLEVSVIIPARNEEASLGACLTSLVEQKGVKFEIIVVDDGSTDRTREIAESFAGVRVITPPPLPEGWVGKNNALVAGAREASGAWLLFTDADTVHARGSLARSLAEARREHAALLSYSPEQEVHGFWERAIMPLIFSELARTYRPSLVSNPRSAAAAANGQYLLITRQAYGSIGGHAAVATDLLEDVAIARVLKQRGERIYFRYAADAVRTRMYRSFRQLREGWTKNLALLFPHPFRLATLRMLELMLVLGGTVLVVRGIVKQQHMVAVLAGIEVVTLFALFLSRTRRANFSAANTILAFLGLPVFSYLLWRSRLSHKKGSVMWKGRTYPIRRANERTASGHAGAKEGVKRGLLDAQS